MPGTLAAAVCFGVLWTLPVALMPLAIGRGIDAALGAGSPSAGASSGAATLDTDSVDRLLLGVLGFGDTMWTWVGVLLALGTVQVISVGLLEYYSATLWLRAAIRIQRAVLRHSTRVGAALPHKIRTGDVVAIGSSDVYQIGNVLEVLGSAAGSLVAFLVVAAIVLEQSPLLGTVVLIGVPLATAGLAPLLGPLRRRTEEHREQVGAATTIAADIVSGLRILRGIGGEQRFADRFAATSQRVRRAGVEAGRIDSWLSGIEVLLPGLVTVAVTWLGARLAHSGDITLGELVAFYAVSAFLVIPVGVATHTAHSISEALVAARRVVTLLQLRPALDSPPAPVPLPPGPLGLREPESGLYCPPGQLTVIHPSGSADKLADRLGRYVDCPVSAGTPDREVPLRDADLAEVRRRIVVAHNQDVLFSGRLSEEVQLDSGDSVRPEVRLEQVLWAADASDVVAGLPNGVHERLTERGRRLSGGQRQRLTLARALSVHSEVLVLDEPTSAVDAHTEARIARRVARLRKGRTTVVITRSPLWAAVADRVLNQPEVTR